MADAVASQTIMDAAGMAVMKFTNISDGTGEAAVTKVDVSTLNGAPNDVTIEKIIYSTAGMSVDILWDADTDVLAFHIPADDCGELNFGREYALTNNSGTGKNGDIKFTTIGHAAADRYSIVLFMRKRTV